MRLREVLLLVVVVAVVGPLLRPPRLSSSRVAPSPFTIEGAALSEPGAEIQERWGKPVVQLPRHDKAPGEVSHRHIYCGRLGEVDVEFDDSLFTAMNVRGKQLEFGGKTVSKAGEPSSGLHILNWEANASEEEFAGLLDLKEIFSEREPSSEKISSYKNLGGTRYDLYTLLNATARFSTLGQISFINRQSSANGTR